MGYHSIIVTKGIYGELDKIQEEFTELKDAHNMGDKILMICECSDLYGALEGFVEKHFGLTMEDLKKFSDKTKSAFKEGKR